MAHITLMYCKRSQFLHSFSLLKKRSLSVQCCNAISLEPRTKQPNRRFLSEARDGSLSPESNALSSLSLAPLLMPHVLLSFNTSTNSSANVDRSINNMQKELPNLRSRSRCSQLLNRSVGCDMRKSMPLYTYKWRLRCRLHHRAKIRVSKQRSAMHGSNRIHGPSMLQPWPVCGRD